MAVAKSQSAGPVSRRARRLFLPRIVLDRSSATPLYEQLRTQLGEAVLGTGEQGAPLPSSRLLARLLGVSRNTVVLAYEDLVGRGLVEGRRGSRMTVAGRTGASAPPDPQRLLLDAQYPSRTIGIADPDDSTVHLVY